MLKATAYVAARELRRMLSNRHLRLICLVSPFLYAVILSAIYVHKRINEVPIGLVDMDNSALSRQAARWLDATENVDIYRSYDSEAEASGAVVRGEVHGFIYIPKDFSRDIKRGGDGKLRVAADYSNVTVANPILMAASDTAGALSAQEFSGLAARCGLVRRRIAGLNQLVAADVRPIFNPQMNYSDFFIPGLILVILQQVMLVALSFTVADERQNGRGEELLSLCGGELPALVAGKAAPYVLLNFLIMVFFIFCLLPGFDLGLQTGAAQTLLFALSYVACVTGFGLVISALFRDTVSAFLALMFVSMPAFLISGFSWPAYTLPWAIRLLSLPFPSSHAMIWFRMALGAPLPPGALALPALKLAALAAFYFFAAWLILRRLYRRAGIPAGH